MILEDSVQYSLRQSGVISESEIALKVGDLFVAENVLDKTRRHIEVSGATAPAVNESTQQRTLLKG